MKLPQYLISERYVIAKLVQTPSLNICMPLYKKISQPSKQNSISSWYINLLPDQLKIQ